MSREQKISKKHKQEIARVLKKYKKLRASPTPHKKKFLFEGGMGALWGTCLAMDLAGGAGSFMIGLHTAMTSMSGLLMYGEYHKHKNKTWVNAAHQVVVANENVENVLNYMEQKHNLLTLERSHGQEDGVKENSLKGLKEIYNDVAVLAPLYDIKKSSDHIYQFYDRYRSKTTKEDIAIQNRRKKPKSLGR